MFVGDPGTGGQADAGGEEGLADAVDIGWAVAIDRLTVHGFPQRTALDVCSVEGHAKGFHVVVGLAVGDGTAGSVCDACRTAYGARYNLAVGQFFILNF